LACGSGACAAAVIGISNKAMSSPVKVNFKQGSILVDYKVGSRKIYAEGSATFLEEIEIKI
jgi:diaminopimelate epimerase